MDRKTIATGAFFGMTAVVLGAFGAHGLKPFLDLNQLATFETGVKYQFYHAALLLILGFSSGLRESTRKWTLYSVSAGILFFSGSLYLLATDHMNEFNYKSFGFITPVGGLLLIIGWGLLFADVIRKKS